MIKLRIPNSSVRSLVKAFKPTQKKLEGLGVFIISQIRRRHASHGMSGGKYWKRKKRDDGRAVLTGRTGKLLDSWFTYSTLTDSGGRVVVANPVPFCHVHELGTKGKGGKLPTIVPRKAKALFIPLSSRAQTSVLGAASISGRNIRVATRGRKTKAGGRTPLVYGKDFVLAKKVDIPPRPQLPVSDREILEQGKFVAAWRQ